MDFAFLIYFGDGPGISRVVNRVKLSSFLCEEFEITGNIVRFHKICLLGDILLSVVMEAVLIGAQFIE